MSYTTFPITYGPTFPVERQQTPRVNVSNFGDGYEQASGDGINIFKPTITVSWESGLAESDAMGADTFLSNLGGQTPFMWQYPGDGSATQWVCRKWKPIFVGVNNWGFTADFIRNFNP